MKKVIQSLVLCIIALTISLTATAKTLTYATDCAPGSMRAEAEDTFLKEVESLSKGEIKIQRFWGSSLLKVKESLRGIQNGVVDMAMINPARYPKRLVYLSGALLFPEGPIAYQNKMDVFRKIYDLPLIKKQIKSYKQRPLFLYGISYLGSAFNIPVSGFKDFKDHRVRASARWHLNAINSLQGVPVSLPFSDVYMSLQTKAIDGVLTNVDALHRGKIHEVAPYLVAYKQLWTPVAFMINISERSYRSLSPKHKRIMSVAAENADKKFAAAYDRWMNKLISDIQNGGGKVTFGTQADVKLFSQLPVHKENEKLWISELNKQGIKEAADLMEQMRNIVNQAILKERNP